MISKREFDKRMDEEEKLYIDKIVEILKEITALSLRNFGVMLKHQHLGEPNLRIYDRVNMVCVFGCTLRYSTGVTLIEQLDAEFGRLILCHRVYGFEVGQRCFVNRFQEWNQYKEEVMNTVDNRYEGTDANGGLRYGIIEVTTRCQLRCPGCYMVRRDALNRGQMTLEQAIRVLDLCREYRGIELETMDILGGEPLLWPHLKEYVDELLRREIKPWIFTNMLAITSEMAGWLRERGVHITGKLNISNEDDPGQIHLQAEMIGSTRETAHKLFRAIDIFKNAGYRDPMFRLQNLLRKKNLPFVPGYIYFCRMNGIGVDLELMGSGEAIDSDYFSVAPTPEELAGLIRELDMLGKESMAGSAMERQDGFYEPPEFRNPMDKVLMPHLFGSCPFYDNGLYFAVDGHIRACSNSTTVLSRITDQDPIRTAYHSTLVCNRRQLCQKNVGEPCHSCKRWDKCRGGCRATVEGMGDPFGGYTLCPIPHL
jgi:radical SAM protein with 4Fe4S-binding SPASM domain